MAESAGSSLSPFHSRVSPSASASCRLRRMARARAWRLRVAACSATMSHSPPSRLTTVSTSGVVSVFFAFVRGCTSFEVVRLATTHSLPVHAFSGARVVDGRL